MINLVAIVGSPRIGKSTDLLVDEAIRGARAAIADCRVEKINLIEHDIGHCRNCLACRDSPTEGPLAECVIKDGMVPISEAILRSDRLILGTPVHMGYATGLMTSFLERICWTFAKPEKSYLVVRGCPRPRSDKQRKAVIIVTSGIVPPYLRRTCDQAAPLIRQTIKDSLNAKPVGDLYAGDLEHRGLERYLGKAFALGRKLV